MPIFLKHSRVGGYLPWVRVPRTLRVSALQPDFLSQFRDVMAEWQREVDLGREAARSEPPIYRSPEGVWVRFSGAPLPCPVQARIERASDGRFVVSGLFIDWRGAEITWETLRAIKPGQLVSYLFAGFQPDKGWRNVNDAVGATVSAPEEKDVSPELANLARLSAAWDVWSHHRAGEFDEPIPSVRRKRVTKADNLTRFAEVYLRHLAATPHKATAETARELHISRATAIRRIAEARDHGLLPPKDERHD